GKWAAYMSVWHHDIAIGGVWGSGGKLYINEPNTGVHGYGGKTGNANFLSDLNAYVQSRRDGKTTVANTDPAHYWFYRPA
ncbi:MAG: hypothetical protein N2C14_19725, partial [Planctomycetales bacterium]